MKTRETYKTKQKDQIIEVIKGISHEFTIKDIYERLDKKIGLTTIYRLVDKLVSDGHVNKTIGKDNVVFYQYLEECCKENHFYLKCVNCGTMEHVDCDCIGELSSHISKSHNFSLTNNVVINGVCNTCEKEGNHK